MDSPEIRYSKYMYQPKTEKDIRCPLEYGLTLFGGKWKTRILCVLNLGGQMRYSTLRAEMTDITDAVLASSLKELVRDGLVNRVSFNEVPPHVEYCLTDTGRSVIPILQHICRWAEHTMTEDRKHTMKLCERCSYTEQN